MRKVINCFVGLSLLVMSSCSDDGSTDDVVRVFEAGFAGSEYGLGANGETVAIEVAFTEATMEETTIVLEVVETGVTHGQEYIIDQDVEGDQIEMVVPASAESATFTVTRNGDVYEGGATVAFTLVSVEGASESAGIVASSAVFNVFFEEVIATGGIIDFETGGSTFPNHAYVDLSKLTQTTARRDTWELAFSSADDNTVYLNASLLVTAAELTEFTDIDAVTSTTTFSEPLALYQSGVEVAVHTVAELSAGIPISYTQFYFADGTSFADSQDGSKRAIASVSATDEDNKVYLIGMGNEIPSEPNTESGINVTGAARGFYKVRVTMDGDDYVLQYASIDATSHKEVTISKDSDFNHIFFSLMNDEIAEVEPAATNWDLNMIGVFSFHSYGYGFTYSDYMLHNTLGGVSLYQVTTIDGDGNAADVPSYTDFSLDDVDEASLNGTNRALIGSGWRNAFGPIAVNEDRYFVAKDAEGNYFKFEFTRLLSEDGERGHAQMQYELLQ